jgi:uncharacterized damage-inducible protein DinB
MDLIAHHRDQLRRSLHGPAWHGPALLEVLADVTPGEAYARSIGGVRTIAEITAHSLAWIEEVMDRLRSGQVKLPARGDWPDLKEQSAASWSELLRLLESAGTALDRALAGFPADRLLERVGGAACDPPLGSGVSYAVMLHGLAQHHAYHGGQISLLKHALRRSTALIGAARPRLAEGQQKQTPAS